MTLNRRVLNRTTLDRQLLLSRSGMTAAQAIERLVAIQGQDVNPPYFGLWSRLTAFTQDDLITLLHGKQVVRGSLLRGTQHLALADDYLWLRPLVQPSISRQRQAAFGRDTRDVDLDELAELAHGHLRGRTLSRSKLRDLLAVRWPDVAPMALGWSAQALLPIVHTPPSGIWNKGGGTPFTLAEEWLGRPLQTAPPVERMVTRYLAGFGPASVMDVQAWSGLTRLRPVIEAMGLREYRDEQGKVLYDLPDAPLADGDEPAPVRFLPYFDNLCVAYADRTRLMTDEQRKVISVGATVYPTFLVDGMVAGMWDLQDGGLVMRPFAPLPAGVVAELEEEGARLLAFAGFPGGPIKIAE
ncbi:winged helix DNA-binding domain-containing protein [Nonomuraea sp. NPDC048826]|uniref:winged helix DNA-binding domain-containing protein n=1 Tax=Nonomuraea sp. NPDC048826 TaxID=3364347 RepID=UPI003712CCDF